MRIRPYLLTGVLLAAFGLVLAAQSQTPRPTAPTGAASPGLPSPPPRPLPPSTTAATTGTGVIRGTVVRADTGQPLRKARVSVRLPGSPDARTATTDANGRYELKGLPASRYVPAAARDGFAEASYGQKRPLGPATPIDLTEGQTIERIDFALVPGGAIAGRVLDDAAEPLARAIVRAVHTRDRRQVAAQDVTDDLGEFRLFGLAPGNYVVSVTVGTDPGLRLPDTFRRGGGVPGPTVVTYYPGTLAPTEAKPIHVDAGAEVTGLSIGIGSVRVATLTGIVRTSTGGVPPQGTRFSYLAVRSRGNLIGNLIRSDGTFALENLPPDRYQVLAQAPGSDQMALADVTIDGADVSVVLTLRTGDTLRGRFTFDTDTDTPAGLQPSSVRVRLLGENSALFPPSSPLVTSSPVRDDWTFEIPGLIGQHRFGVASLPEGWGVRSIRLGGRDIMDQPLDFNGKDIDDVVVQLTQRLTTVTGQVSDDRGQKVGGASVVLFAEDRERWPSGRFTRLVASDQEGRFTVRGLPAGRYLAVALDVFERGMESDVDLLEELRRLGVALTLTEAGSAALNLKVTAAP